MTAPALILLADGSTDRNVVDVIHTLRVGMQEMRPEVSVHVAFLDHCPPSGPQVVSQLAKQGVREIVFVPLNLSALTPDSPAIDSMVNKVTRANPSISFVVGRPVGPEAGFLSEVDAQLRAALLANHVTELDGLVLAVEGAAEQRSTALLARRARQWSQHHNLPVVVATADGSTTSTTRQIASLRAQGRRHIAVGSLLLTPGSAWQTHRDEAVRAGAVAVAAPIGAHALVMDAAWGRYAVAAMDLLDFGFDEPAATHRHLSVVGA